MKSSYSARAQELDASCRKLWPTGQHSSKSMPMPNVFWTLHIWQASLNFTYGSLDFTYGFLSDFTISITVQKTNCRCQHTKSTLFFKHCKMESQLLCHLSFFFCCFALSAMGTLRESSLSYPLSLTETSRICGSDLTGVEHCLSQIKKRGSGPNINTNIFITFKWQTEHFHENGLFV